MTPFVSRLRTWSAVGALLACSFAEAAPSSLLSDARLSAAPLDLQFARRVALVGVKYEETLLTGAASDGSGLAWAVIDGELPPGLVLTESVDGGLTLLGAPNRVGDYSFSLTVSDTEGRVATHDFVFDVVTLPAGSFVAPSDGFAAAGQAESSSAASVTTAGGDGGYFTLPSVIVPAGATVAGQKYPKFRFRDDGPVMFSATAPTIALDPVSQIANLTDRVTFAVATTGTPPAFQWQKNGVNIPNAVYHTLTLPSVAASDAASYRVVVTNSAGSQTSAAATLTVNSLVPQPFTTTTVFNDAFTDNERATQSLPGSLKWFSSGLGTELVASGGAMTLTPASGNGRHAVAHFPLQTIPVGGTLTLSFDVTLTSPTKNGVLRLGLFNKNGNADFTADNTNPSVTYRGYVAYVNVAPTSANPHQVRERNNTASALITSSTGFGNALGLGGGGPTMPFENGVAHNVKFKIWRTEADRVTLTVTCGGGAMAGHTFSRNDINITEALDTVALCLYGSGGVVAASAATFDNVSLTLTSPSIVDTFADNERATQAPPESLAWFASHASNTLTVGSGAMTIDTSGTTSRHAVAHFPAQGLAIGETLHVSFDFAITNPRTDGIVRFGVFHTNGGTAFSADNSNPNVSFPGYAVFTNIAPSAASPTSWRERSSSPAAALITHSGAYGGALTSAGGPQQSFTAGETYRGELFLTRTASDTMSLTVTYTGAGLSGYTLMRTDTAITSTFDTVALCAYGATGTAGVDTLAVDHISIVRAKAPATPTLTIPPVNRTVNFGDSFALGVEAAGEPSGFTYQWSKGGVVDAAATQPFYSFPNVKTTAANTYSVTVSNGTGSVTSSTVTVTVNNLSPMQALPSITTQPSGQTVSSGANVSFTAAATGTPTPTYQWRRNSVNISGQTNATLSFSAVQPANAGDYTVLVNNSSGSVISSKATLVVNGAPAISAQPLTQTVRPNSTVILRVSADGTPPLSYQWKKNGAAIAGATGLTLLLPNVQSGDAATYVAEVTNSSGTTTSSGAVLSVVAPGTTYASAKVVDDGSGNLSYPADGDQNRVVDFSYAGYKGGGVPLPAVPVVSTLAPISGDNTASIQAAIAAMASLPVQANGYRGTLRLSAGTFRVDGTVNLNVSGVVLAGVGDEHNPANNTILQRTTTSLDPIVLVGGGYDDKFRSEIANTRSEITTAFVQVGARSFEVDTPGLYAVGDHVVVHHPAVDGWLSAIDYGGTAEEPWLPNGTKDLRYLRYITAISGNTITIDAPIYNHLDRNLSQSYLYKYNRTGLVTNVGLENFLVDIATNGDLSEDHAEACIEFVEVEDGWARKVTTQHFVRYGIVLGGDCSRVTVDSCRAIEPHSTVAGARRYNFATYHAQLVLFRNCYTSSGRHSYVNSGGSIDAGVVFLDCVADTTLSAAEPHAWWSTATLYDNVVVQHPGVTNSFQLYNAGDVGDHGWCAAHSVIWRSAAGQIGGTDNLIVVQKPPTAQNYVIGSFGNVTGDGLFEQPAGFIERTGQELAIRSLYRAQLADRLGLAADGPTTTTVLSDTYADGNRNTQSLPGSAAWFSSHTASSLSVVSGAMSLTTAGTTSRHAVAHFPAKTLGIGDTLNLAFDFTVDNPRTDGVVRFGLFDSNGGSLFSADNTNPNVTYTGYAVLTNIAPTTANPTSFRRRTDITAAALITQTGGYGTGFGAGGPTQSFVAGTTYHAEISVTVTGVDSATLTVTYTGGSLSGYTVTTNVSGIVSRFDTLAFCVYGSGGVAGADGIAVDNVTVTHRSTP